MARRWENLRPRGSGHRFVEENAHDALRNRASLDHLQGRLQRAQPAGSLRVIHSSNLCTEITLNTSADETAVCNLGSIVSTTHLRDDGSLDHEKLGDTIKVAIRALDNVIDINFYPTEAARRANMRTAPSDSVSWAAERPLQTRTVLRFSGSGRVQRRIHGGHRLSRLRRFVRSGGGARRLFELQGLEVGSRAAAAGHARFAGTGTGLPARRAARRSSRLDVRCGKKSAPRA
jgi:hypothetical protein